MKPKLIRTAQAFVKATKEGSDELHLLYVDLEIMRAYFLQGNSKRHEFEKLGDSIDRFNFADPIKFDVNAPGEDGVGAVIEGNGRLEYLTHLHGEGGGRPQGYLVRRWEMVHSGLDWS